MRELKFRAWDKIFKFYVGEDEFIGITFDGKCLIYQDEITDEVEFSKIDNFIVEQYTGLRDKNGDEIYEGDIVKQFVGGYTGEEYADKRVCQVRWCEKACGFELHYITGGFFDNLMMDNDDYEVIGNIHENPDLLFGGKE